MRNAEFRARNTPGAGWLRCQVFIGAYAVDGNELSRGKAAGNDFITRAQQPRVLLFSAVCNSIVSRARTRSNAEKEMGQVVARCGRNREGRPRSASETIAGGETTHGEETGGLGDTLTYITTPRDSSKIHVYVCMRARVYKRDSPSSITSETAKERINLARGNYIRGKMRLLLIPINSHVALFLCDQD